MILETIGLPGGGKTYLCNEIEKNLNKSVHSLNILKYTSNIFLFKIIKKIFILASNQTKIAKNIKKEIKAVLKNEDIKSKFSIYDDESYSINMICSFIILYKLLKKSKKVYIFDEGVVHTAIKMCADFGFSEKTFNEIINIIESSINNEKWYVVYNHIDIKSCINSIKNRNRHICAFDELSDNDLYSILQYYDKYNKYYCNTRKVVRVERNEYMNRKLEFIKNKILR